MNRSQSVQEGQPPGTSLDRARQYLAHHQVLLGIGLMVTSTIGFSISHTLIRMASEDLHPFQVTFFRNFFGLSLLIYPIMRQGLLPVFRTRRLKLHLLRVLFSAFSLITFYYALSITPLAKITALGFITPLFVIVLAALFLHERMGPTRIAAVALGLCGAIVVVRPGFVTIDLGTGLMLASSLVFAGALFCIKLLTRTESAVTMTGFAFLLMTPITLVPALTVWRWPDPLEWVIVAAIGVISVGSVVIFTTALKRAATHVLMPLDYLRLVWMALIGYFLFAEIPDIYTVLGGSLIFASATFVTLSEYRHGRRTRGGEA